MQGTVVAHNVSNGLFMIAITDTGEFVVIELLDTVEIELGDIVSGGLEELGGVTLFHQRSGEEFEAYGQSGPSSKEAALRLLR